MLEKLMRKKTVVTDSSIIGPNCEMLKVGISLPTWQ